MVLFYAAIKIVVLVAAWCALWGDVSFANVISGFLVAAAASFSGNKLLGRSGIHVGAVLRFARLVFIDLVLSTIGVAWTILQGTKDRDEAIIAVKVPDEAKTHFFLLVTAVTVTPGTAVVDIDSTNATLYLHLLDKDKRQLVKNHVDTLSHIACKAFPSPQKTSKGVAI